MGTESSFKLFSHKARKRYKRTTGPYVMERYASVTIDDVSVEDFEALPIPYGTLDWIRATYHADGHLMHATYNLTERTLETIGLDIGYKRFVRLERGWGLAPFIIESEKPTYFDEGWRHIHLFSRTPRRDELLRELALNAPPDVHLTAHYVGIPEGTSLPKGAFVWPPARTNK